jgi:cytochrome P450
VQADYLIGLTPAMVAGGYRNEVFWNYFSAAQGRVLMVSTTDLREYAAKARRPFEVAVGGLMVATLLAQMTEGLDFHENRGCIFDKNEDRHTLVRNIRKPAIEPECLDRMSPRLRAAALAIIERLKAME